MSRSSLIRSLLGIALGGALCAAASNGYALSIGSIRGGVTVGQAVDLGFDVTLDAGSDAGTSCIVAELFYGDSRVDPARVRVNARAGSQPSQAVVQVGTSVAVNEPVVSVVVRAGCSPSLSRRYVLLASSPVDAPTAAAMPGIPAATTRGFAGAPSGASGGITSGLGPRPLRAVPPAGDADTSAASSSSTDAPVVRRSAPRPAAPRKTPVATTTARAEPARAPSRARLELQSPVEWLEEQTLPLRYSSAMATPAPATPEQRAAAAALWRSLSAAADGTAPPDAEATQRVQALEQQVKLLQNAASRNRGREAELQAALDKAQQERDAFFLYLWPAVAVLVLLFIIAGVFLWRRGGKRAAWWKPESRSSFGADAITGYGDAFVDTRPEAMESVYPLDAAITLPPPLDEEPAAPRVDKPAVAATVEPEAAAPHSAEAATLAARELRSSSSNALADVQQNADFFASLGQYDQAIDLLQQYIADHPGTSPAAYLDLLRLLHTLSLTDPFRKLRTEFNAAFNGEVPAFAAFLKSTRDLSAYPEVLQRIADVWATPEVLDLIESLLVRQGGEGAHPAFQLEAYRELLLLYEIAKAEHGEATGVRPEPVRVVPAAVLDPEPVVRKPPPPPAPARLPSMDLDGLDFVPAAFEPPKKAGPARTTEAAAPAPAFDLGMPLEFADTVIPPAEADALQDLSLPEIELPAEPPQRAPAPASVSRPAASVTPPPAAGFAPAPAADSNLIDFDLFDVDATKPPKA